MVDVPDVPPEQLAHPNHQIPVQHLAACHKAPDDLVYDFLVFKAAQLQMFHLPEIEFAVLENLLHRIDARADENETAPLAKLGFQILKHLLLNPADTLAVLGKHNVLILFEYNVHLLRLGARNAVRQLQQAPDVVVVYVPVQGQDPSAVAELLHVVLEMSLRKQPRHRLCIIRHAQLRGLDDSRS